MPAFYRPGIIQCYFLLTLHGQRLPGLSLFLPVKYEYPGISRTKRKGDILFTRSYPITFPVCSIPYPCLFSTTYIPAGRNVNFTSILHAAVNEQEYFGIFEGVAHLAHELVGLVNGYIRCYPVFLPDFLKPLCKIMLRFFQ